MNTKSPQSRAGTIGETVVIVGVISILVVLFSPISNALLDFLLITNLSTALLVLLLTFYTDRPLAFSTFPSILLIATLFRLSLNVAATRLILTDANAGKVIHAVGTYVVSGNYVIGLVVFFILIVVQFVVVTNGAQRVAEVAARFTLDAMPGKQMSIDADLNMGLINETQARDRRRDIEREANFYGAMDGASKFVKGDAIAGIIIILINIIGGLTIGLAQKGMDWSTALRTYTLLTVGDGIVTQIPALVIATATGIIVTRAATDSQLSQELLEQVTRYPKSLLMLCGALTIALLLPGIPAIPVAILLCVIGGLSVMAFKRRKAADQAEAEATAPEVKTEETDIYASLRVVPVELEFGGALKPLIGDADGLFMRRLKAFRRQHALEQGLVVPAVRLKEDPRRPPNSYSIRFFDATIAEGFLAPDSHLAINPGRVTRRIEGTETKDPTFGLPAVWIDSARMEEARAAGYTVVEPVTVLVTHFSEIIRNQGYQLLTRKETEQLVRQVRDAQPSLVEEMIPSLMTLSDVQKVLQLLLRERVPIRNLEFILEALAEAARQTKESEALTERVREKLSLSICQRFASRDGMLHVLMLDAGLDRQLREATRPTENMTSIVLDPALLDRLTLSLVKNTEAMLSSNLTPVLLCPPPLRRILRRVSEGVLPHLNVVSSTEIPPTAVVKAFGTIAA